AKPQPMGDTWIEYHPDGSATLHKVDPRKKSDKSATRYWGGNAKAQNQKPKGDVFWMTPKSGGKGKSSGGLSFGAPKAGHKKGAAGGISWAKPLEKSKAPSGAEKATGTWALSDNGIHSLQLLPSPKGGDAPTILFHYEDSDGSSKTKRQRIILGESKPKGLSREEIEFHFSETKPNEFYFAPQPSGANPSIRRSKSDDLTKAMVRRILGVKHENPVIFLDFGHDKQLEKRVLRAIRGAMGGNPGPTSRPAGPRARFRFEDADPTSGAVEIEPIVIEALNAEPVEIESIVIEALNAEPMEIESTPLDPIILEAIEAVEAQSRKIEATSIEAPKKAEAKLRFRF
ncbi:MAG: hypothetical protein AAF488_10915, partial [Planctomycetota bacterium]